METEDNGVNVFRRIYWAIEAAQASTTDREVQNRIENIQVHSHGYAEPGCDDPESGAILTANWNDVTRYNLETKELITIDHSMDRLARIFEKMGCEIEWCDMWATCNDCCKLVKTSPEPCWTPSYHIVNGEHVCHDCLDAEEYLEGLEGEAVRTNQMFDPEDHGYVLVADDFERGLHRGQDSDPRLIGKLMTEAGFSRWLFNLDGVGQFDSKFSLWLHEEEAEEEDGDGLILAKRTIERGNTDGPSIAAAMERGLQAASQQSSEMRAAGATGVLVSKVGMDGAETKEVSHEDLLGGKALD